MTPRTILLVEDNDIYRQVACLSLQRQFVGWTILGAASLAEARVAISTNPLDVVITDLGLPDGTGMDLLPALAAAVAKGLRLVALTNESARDVLEGLKLRGYHGFVAKEHGVKALCDAVEAVLAGGTFVSRQPEP